MSFEEELLNLLREYLNSLSQGKSVIDIIVDYCIPILSAVILVGSTLAAVIKYYSEKNRDFNEKILNEVYAPLYQYIIKQEYIRHLRPEEMPLNDYPIISLTNEKTTIKNMLTIKQETIVETTDIMKNTDLLKVSKSVNFGLAPQELLVLLNAYEMANLVQADVPDDEFNAIEQKLRKAIITGYNQYKKKLGLKNDNKLVEYKDNEIIFNLK